MTLATDDKWKLTDLLFRHRMFIDEGESPGGIAVIRCSACTATAPGNGVHSQDALKIREAEHHAELALEFDRQKRGDTSRPKNSPAVIYWVGVEWPRGNPKARYGGKYTKYDEARRRCLTLQDDGANVILYRTALREWEILEDFSQ